MSRLNIDLFISYARHDNKNKLISGFLENLRDSMQLNIARVPSIFFDETDVEIGAEWEHVLLDKLATCRLMLAFLSPAYFRSANCIKEWKTIHKRNPKAILPVSIIPFMIPDTKINLENELPTEHRSIFNQAAKVQHLQWYKTEITEHESALKDFGYFIHNKLINETDLGRELPRENYHVIDESIENELTPEKRELLTQNILKISQKRKFSHPPVCVIYTGGTIGMVYKNELGIKEKNILKQGTVSEFIENIYRWEALEVDVDFYSYRSPLDSSAINIDDWMKLASIIQFLYKYYQGFVILHGTNTMAYTASALSFLFENLNKPIILTGAEIPLVYLNSDAQHNFTEAINIASPSPNRPQEVVKEVCILFGRYLLRGNRSTKRHATESAISFDSPNSKPLGESFLNRFEIHLEEVRRYEQPISDRENLQIQFSMSKAGILVMELYPDMDISHYQTAFDDKNLRGIIIKSYGSGNAREDADFLDVIRKLLERDIIIVNISQCYEGGVELKLYETTAKLFDLGVINGGDMTLESAYCKLRYLLGRFDNQENIDVDMIKKDMQVNIKGELTHSIFSIKYTLRDQKLIADPIFRGRLKRTEHFNFSHADIDYAVLRIQGIRLLKPVECILTVRVYFNNNNVDFEEREQDIFYRIALFSRNIGNGDISHNIEVTERIRHLVKLDNSPATIQIVSGNNIAFHFDSVELSIFTKSK